MRCCVDIVKFILFFLNLIAFLSFIVLEGGAIFLLLKGESSFLGQNIEPSLETSNPTAIYFMIIIICLVIFSFLILFTCLGCCGTAFKSSCMIGCFIVIDFVLFGASVGGIVFLHYQYSNPVREILEQELSRSVSSYTQESVLMKGFWDWFLETAQCCGIGEEGWKVWARAGLKDGYRVPRSCCRPNQDECMYEPSRDDTYTTDCVPVALPYVQAIFYGLPSIMLVTLIFAFVVTGSFNQRYGERRKEERPYRTHSQYSIGADEEFQHTAGDSSYPSAPYENSPYNPHGVGDYPTGVIPPPDPSSPLLHQPPPSYNEVVRYSSAVRMSYRN